MVHTMQGVQYFEYGMFCTKPCWNFLNVHTWSLQDLLVNDLCSNDMIVLKESAYEVCIMLFSFNLQKGGYILVFILKQGWGKNKKGGFQIPLYTMHSKATRFEFHL